MSRMVWTLAERRGSRIAEQWGAPSLPINPRIVAEKKQITVASKPLTGCSGCLVRQGDTFGILYSSNLPNEGMVNFTIAHELGHYFLDGHAEALFPDGDGIHQSSGPFRSSDPREREADHFAVGLLMPESLFVKAGRTAGDGLDAIEALAAACGTSITATAIRFANLADGPVAMVVATEKRIDFCFMSESLRSLRGLEWPKKGNAVPGGTVTAKLAAKPEDVESARRLSGSCSFADWIEGAPDCNCTEEVVGLGRFGQTLTVIWSEDELDEEEESGDDDL